MIKITRQDFDKLVKLLLKEGQDGASLAFSTNNYGAGLIIETFDRQNKKMVIEISDESSSFMPRITRTETF